MPDYKPSLTQRLLYDALKRRHLNPVWEYEIPGTKFRADMAFLDVKLIVEVDGEPHHDPKHDHNRDELTERLGWTTRRYQADEVYDNPDKIAFRVEKYYEDLKQRKTKIPRTVPNPDPQPNPNNRKALAIAGVVTLLLFVVLLTAFNNHDGSTPTLIPSEQSMQQVAGPKCGNETVTREIDVAYDPQTGNPILSYEMTDGWSNVLRVKNENNFTVEAFIAISLVIGEECKLWTTPRTDFINRSATVAANTIKETSAHEGVPCDYYEWKQPVTITIVKPDNFSTRKETIQYNETVCK